MILTHCRIEDSFDGRSDGQNFVIGLISDAGPDLSHALFCFPFGQDSTV